MSTKFTCRFCKEQFDVPKGLYKHLQLVHNAGISRDNRTCPICGVLCSKYESYRDHLLYIHGQTDDGQKLTFKSLNEFLVWKTELELKHNCKYVLQTSPKVLPTKEKKYFYQCDRSDSKSKDKKSLSVVMKTCSSVISVVEGTGVFKVEYWDTHSGHTFNETPSPSAVSVQNELEAAISSVEMVNAIGDSDDSYDRTDELLMPENSNSSNSNIEKQTFFTKANNLNNSPITNTLQKTKTMQSFGKADVPKKKTNTSVLFSLASVACGKGISKKSTNKSTESKSSDNQSSSKTGVNINSKNIIENKNSANFIVKQKDDLVSKETTSAEKSEETTIISTTSSTSSVKTKPTPSGPLAIAPKITGVATNTINSLFTANSTFSNQFVIVNPVSMDQSSLTSNQVLTTGQNILLSLGPVGQNVPTNNAPQTKNQISSTQEKKSVSNSKASKSDSSPKVNTSSKTIKKLLSDIQSEDVINAVTTTSNSNITLTSGLNNTPVILGSLPVGSTFMSVNNNLIPIASPSGTFIPTSLPPNIVLTPVMPGTSLPNVDSSNTTISSVNALSSPPQNLQTQVRFSAPSTVAITVSSIVKEPVYTSSAIKHMGNIVTSSTSPVTSTSSPKSSRQRNKFVPITTAGRLSPIKSVNKSSASSKSSSNVNKIKNSSSSFSNKGEINLASTSKCTNKIGSPISNKYMPLVSSVTGVSISSPPGKPSARKRITRNIKSKLSTGSVGTPVNDSSSTFNTKVVNSRLHLTPISSTPDVTITPQLNAQKPGTMLFESSAGEIYMLEPVENDENPVLPKSIPTMETSKIKIDRSMQTSESSGFAALRSKLQRKRAAPPTDDSAVMLKVKCYQLEMKYLNSQTECKRLKVELTKERLKNAELSGKTAPISLEEETANEISHQNAVEIMKEIEDKFSENKDMNIYTMTKTSVLRSLYDDLEELCIENSQLHKELENYRAHDKFYKNLKKRLYDEEF